MLEWEWYDDINTKVLFIHLLLKANWKDREYRGRNIKRGTFVTWRIILAQETWLTEQQIRTSLNKLKSTSEITITSTTRDSLITILKYDKYQWDNQEDNQRVTNKQPTDNQRVTTTNKVIKKESNKEINKVSKDTTAIAEYIPKLITADINNLIQVIKETCDELWVAYDKDKDRMFAKHILKTKEYWSFCEKINMSREQLAKNIIYASVKSNFWKWACTWPMSIYQNYAEVYNLLKQKTETQVTQKQNIIYTDEF